MNKKLASELEWGALLREWEHFCKKYPEIQMDMPVQKVACKSYQPGVNIYGYDIIPKKEVENWIKKIDSIMLFGKPTNKGTLHTIYMLRSAKTNEERMAIWCAAFAKDLFECGWRFKGDEDFLSKLSFQCESFLHKKFEMWHHAMKRLTPEIYYGFNICHGVKIETWEALVEMIALNAKMVLQDYQLVVYSSWGEEEVPARAEEFFNVRLDGVTI